jgi:FSR family fosmidomycin resistance protein-like MFS transporter
MTVHRAITDGDPAVGGRIAAPTARRAVRIAAIYGVVHAIVDLGSVTAVFRAARLLGAGFLTPFALVVGYDLSAFALQFPLGLLVDRVKGARGALLSGLVLIAAALACIPHSAMATMLAAGVGNALFHIGAGAFVLASSGGRATPAGVFVAPGALGLGLGMWMGRQGTASVWPLAGLLVLSFVVATLVRAPDPRAVEAPAATPAGSREWSVVLVALLVSVAVRSFVGFASPYQAPKNMLTMVGLPFVAFAGKLIGGPISDRVGWIETSVGALVLSAPLIAFSSGSPYVLLFGLLLFQTTMPVTLTAVYLLFPKQPATAFGLPCLALIAGALPTFYPAGKALYGSHTFLALILTSVVAVYLGLTQLGVRRAWDGNRAG